MSKIQIVLDENPVIPEPEFPAQVTDAIKSVIGKAVEAKRTRETKKNIKSAAARLTQSAIAELLENPDGVARSDLLAVAESDNIISLVIRIRNQLKRDKIYTLVKKGKSNSTIYFLQKT
jgi:hypothetical protein